PGRQRAPRTYGPLTASPTAPTAPPRDLEGMGGTEEEERGPQAGSPLMEVLFHVIPLPASCDEPKGEMDMYTSHLFLILLWFLCELCVIFVCMYVCASKSKY